MTLHQIQKLYRISKQTLLDEYDCQLILKELETIDIKLQLQDEDIDLVVQTLIDQQYRIMQDLNIIDDKQSISSLIIDVQVLFISFKLIRKYDKYHLNSNWSQFRNQISQAKLQFIMKLIEKEFILSLDMNRFIHLLIKVSKSLFKQYSKMIWDQSQQFDPSYSMNILTQNIVFVIIALEKNQLNSQSYFNIIMRRNLLHQVFRSWSTQKQINCWQQLIQPMVLQEDELKMASVVEIFVTSMRSELEIIKIVDQLFHLKKHQIVRKLFDILCPQQNNCLRSLVNQIFEKENVILKTNQSHLLYYFNIQEAMVKYLTSSKQLSQNFFKRNLKLFSQSSVDQQKIQLFKFIEIQYLLFESHQDLQLGQYLLQTVQQIQQLSQSPSEEQVAQQQKILKLFNVPCSQVLTSFWGPLFTVLVYCTKEQIQYQSQYFSQLYIDQTKTKLPKIRIHNKYKQFHEKEKLDQLLLDLRQVFNIQSPNSQDLYKLYIQGKF